MALPCGEIDGIIASKNQQKEILTEDAQIQRHESAQGADS